MAGHCFFRSIITLLHLVIAAGSGLLCLFSLLGSGSSCSCLPNLVDHFGDPIQFQNGLPLVYNVIIYGLALLCLLNIFMCVLFNFTWKNGCLAFFHLILTMLFGGFTVFGATTLTVHYMMWCDSLSQNLPSRVVECDKAAEAYDKLHHSDNMTSIRFHMEVQQIGMWALFPLTFIAVLVYGLLMHFTAAWKVQGDDVRDVRYVILHEETTPLMTRDRHGSVNEEPVPSAPGSHQQGSTYGGYNSN